MVNVVIRLARRVDLPRLTKIYNYYVVNTAIVFRPLRGRRVVRGPFDPST